VNRALPSVHGRSLKITHTIPLMIASPDLIKHLRDDRNKDILHHPRQEEDHCDKVEGRFPRIK